MGWELRIAPRRLTARSRPLPDFLIIGAMRCGTTTLYAHLQGHSKVVPAVRSEVHYFDYRSNLGLGWYRAFFPMRSHIPPGGITGEKSPYYLFHPRVPRLVAETLGPGLRVIAILRDPVERAFSHYRMEVRDGREPLSFAEAVDAEEGRLRGEKERMLSDPRYKSFAYQHHSYKARGRYAEQLGAWFSEFDRERILVLKSESLFATPEPVMNEVIEFLGLPRERLGPLPHHNRRQGGAIDAATKTRLRAYFEPYNRSLCELLGWREAW